MDPGKRTEDRSTAVPVSEVKKTVHLPEEALRKR